MVVVYVSVYVILCIHVLYIPTDIMRRLYWRCMPLYIRTHVYKCGYVCGASARRVSDRVSWRLLTCPSQVTH